MKIDLLMQILLAGATAAMASLALNLIVANIAARLAKTPAPFAPFTVLPVVSGCAAGALGASLVFWALHFILDRPQTIFAVIAGILLLASFHLPFRLTNHRSARFAGATLPVQLILCLMHAVVAVCAVVFLLLFI